MTYRLPHEPAAQFTTAIVRMHGKAVKVRHCPATVSAPATTPVVLRSSQKAGIQPGLFRCMRSGPNEPLEASFIWLAFGKVAGEGASQETGPRRF